MKIRTLIVLGLTLSTLAGCQGSGGSGSPGVTPPGDDPANAPASMTMTTSKPMALADGADAVAITVDVKKADGTPVPDGTTVNFSVPDNNGTLSAASVATTNGAASVALTHPPVSGAKNQTVAVTGTAGSISSGKDVKFINQPASAEVTVSIDQAITDLAALNFRLNNGTGASFDNSTQLIAAINGALNSIVEANYDAAANSTNIGLINGKVSGFNTGNTPIIKATFAVASGLPSFSVDPTPTLFTAINPGSTATTPQFTADNMVVTVVFDTEL